MIVTIEDGVENEFGTGVIEDTYINLNSPNSIFSTATQLELNDFLGQGESVSAIAKVILTDYSEFTVLNGKFIITPTYWSITESFDAKAHKLLKPLIIDAVTWNKYDWSTSWDVAGAKGDGDRGDVESTFACNPSSTPTDVSVTVSTIAEWCAGTNNGLLMRSDTAPAGSKYFRFGSSEHSTDPIQFYMEYAVPVATSTSKDISRKDRKTLSTSDDITYVAPEAADADTRYEVASEKAEEPSNINHYLSQYKKIVETSDQVAEILDERCKGFTFKFEPKKMPALAQAIRKVFGKDTSEITYDMYKQVLEEQMVLNEKIGDEIFAQ